MREDAQQSRAGDPGISLDTGGYVNKRKILEDLVVAVGVGLLMVAITTLLWNWLMPEIFGLPTINLWQAFCLTWLCNILFKPFPKTRNE